MTLGKLSYIIGDATNPIGDGHKYIIHICNNKNGWGAGFVLALSKRWTKPEASYRAWARNASLFKLGEIQIVEVEDDISVINMIAQDGFGEDGNPPIRYNHLKTCLEKVAILLRDKNSKVVGPRIGCGLAGGNWITIEAIINETLISQGIDVEIYDLPAK